MYKLKLIRLCVLGIINLGSYCMIRNLIWSIVMIDISKKKKKLNEFHQVIKSKSFCDRLDMKFLGEYVITCKKDFDVWIKRKKLFVITETIISILYLLIPCDNNDITSLALITKFLYIQSAIIVAFILFQFRYDGYRHSKYALMKTKK